MELAVCEVLLGSPDLALSMLREDERIGVALRWDTSITLAAAGLTLRN